MPIVEAVDLLNAWCCTVARQPGARSDVAAVTDTRWCGWFAAVISWQGLLFSLTGSCCVKLSLFLMFSYYCKIYLTLSPLSLSLLVRRQEGHPACKKTECLGAGVVICLERGADLHIAQLMRVPLTVSCFSKIQIGFTFWYRLTWVVLDRGPINGWCVCYLTLCTFWLDILTKYKSFCWLLCTF